MCGGASALPLSCSLILGRLRRTVRGGASPELKGATPESHRLSAHRAAEPLTLNSYENRQPTLRYLRIRDRETLCRKNVEKMRAAQCRSQPLGKAYRVSTRRA